MPKQFSDHDYMTLALKEAEKAEKRREIPVGALAVFDQKIVAQGYNVRESKQSPLGHAEIEVLRKVSKRLGRWRLTGVTLYVTLEPCLMCMGALLQARIDRLVFGCFDPKAGACGSLYDLSQDWRLNHRIAVTSGVLEQACSKKISDFFKQLRAEKSKNSDDSKVCKAHSKTVEKVIKGLSQAESGDLYDHEEALKLLKTF